MLVVLLEQLDLQVSNGVDLLGGDLRAILTGVAIDGGRAGERADDADLYGGGVLSHGGGGQAHDHHEREDHSDDCLVELHNQIPPK